MKETLFPDGTSTKTVYDELGRRVAAIDPLENRTQYEYDKLGRLTDVVQFLDSREIRTEYGYDELGRQIFQEDANDHRTTFEYDLSGRRTAVVLPLGQRSTMVYDGVGNVISETDFNGEVTTYTYDPRNRLEEIDLPDDPDVSYTYTLTGQMETVTDVRGVTSYAYDVRDRLVGRTDPTGPYTGDGFTIEYEYDIAGNRDRVETPGGFTSYSFDERNRLETVADSSQGVTTYKYDGVNNLIETVLPNGVVESREYDELNRLELLEQTLNGSVVASYDYELDDAGNRVSVTEADGRKVEYEYDDLYRLVEEKITDPGDPNDGRVITYEYDDVGNRLRREDSIDGTTTYVYDDNDRLLSETVGGVVTTYEYDDNGNTIAKVVNGTERTEYTWDDRDRLVEVRTPDGDVITYTYDDNNIRVSQTVNGVTTQYIVDDNRDYAQVLEEYVDGELQVRYVHGLDLISQERDGEVSVYLVDGLGSTRHMTDLNGAIVREYLYDAFGKLLDSTGGLANDFLFTGERFDSDLEQYYLRARYYDPNTGRFARRDPFEGILSEPISLHKYIYTANNPINYTDSSGLYYQFVAGLALRGALSGAVFGASFGALTGSILNGWKGALSGALGGAASGALFGAIGGSTIAASAIIGSTLPIAIFGGVSVAAGISSSIPLLNDSDPKLKLIGGINLALTIASGVFTGGALAGKQQIPRFRGGIYRANGHPVSRTATVPDGDYLYVVTREGKLLYLEDRFINHPDLNGGGRVLAAGEMKIRSGKVTFLNNRTGHYQVKPQSLEIAKIILQAQGKWGGNVRIRPVGQ